MKKNVSSKFKGSRDRLFCQKKEKPRVFGREENVEEKESIPSSTGNRNINFNRKIPRSELKKEGRGRNVGY